VLGATHISKKDYKAIAALLADFRQKADSTMVPGQVDDCIVRDLIVPMARLFKVENNKFDYARFLAACGVKAEVA
jgi:hypothetical protein